MFRKNPPLLNYIVRQIKNGDIPVLHSDGNQSRDYIHIDDVLRLIDICLDKNPNDTFNVCSGQLLSVNQMLEYVLESFDVEVNAKYNDSIKLWDTYPNLFSGTFPLHKSVVSKEVNKYSRGSCEKARNILGWEPNTDLKTLIKKVSKEIKL